MNFSVPVHTADNSLTPFLGRLLSWRDYASLELCQLAVVMKKRIFWKTMVILEAILFECIHFQLTWDKLYKQDVIIKIWLKILPHTSSIPKCPAQPKEGIHQSTLTVIGMARFLFENIGSLFDFNIIIWAMRSSD